MKTAENMTFEEAMRYAAQARTIGHVGISIFHRHEYRKIEADEGCYAVYSYSPEELAERRKDSEKPEEPLSPFEITAWDFNEAGEQEGKLLFEADTLDDLLKIAAEQNGTET